jgi:HD-GYP domain-containing protein (c-di-GMP phosphodiesterase class II)
LRDNIRVVSDPFIGSQSGRQNLGVPGFSKLAGAKPAPEPSADPAKSSAAAAPPRAGEAGDGSKQRLTNFLNKLETTWQLFNRGTRESDEGALPKGKTAYLDDSDVPTPASLKELRARATKGSAQYQMAKGPSLDSPGAKGGPKESPLSDQNTGKPGPKSAKGAPDEASAKGAKPGGFPSPSGADKSAALPRNPGSWQPSGLSSSRSFLATATMAGAQLRTSDAAGKPGNPAQAEALARQPVFSQGLAQVNHRVTARQVSGHMPVHSAFLDEHHEKSSGSASPLRLFWSGKPQAAAGSQNPFSAMGRLKFSQAGQQGGQGQTLGSHLSLHSSAALNSARSDIATRFAGKAIHSLLKKLYDEEDVEELDEEEAVNGLGLILRLGGEFTYEHSTRVLDLALELADEVGIKDKKTRKEIRFGAALCDIGEFDLLLQSGDEADKKTKNLESFLGGQDMLRAGLLHDIGKVNIPAEILYKPGKLTPEEYELMKMHPIYGEQIVRPIASLRYLCPTIRGHHERWDGKGYPDGLAGEVIPIAARIISVADVFDALSAERPYKRGMEVDKVRGILSEGRGTHFDPALVDSFLAIIDRRYPDTDLEPEAAQSCPGVLENDCEPGETAAAV